MGTFLFSLLGLLGSGVTIGIALCAGSMIFIMLDPMLNVETVGLVSLISSKATALMAVPLFIFAGFLMEQAGMVRQLFQFAEALVSWIRGGFGLATVTTCVMFSAISGSSVAVASAMSLIAIPEIRKRKYPDWMSAALWRQGAALVFSFRLASR